MGRVVAVEYAASTASSRTPGPTGDFAHARLDAAVLERRARGAAVRAPLRERRAGPGQDDIRGVRRRLAGALGRSVHRPHQRDAEYVASATLRAARLECDAARRRCRRGGGVVEAGAEPVALRQRHAGRHADAARLDRRLPPHSLPVPARQWPAPVRRAGRDGCARPRRRPADRHGRRRWPHSSPPADPFGGRANPLARRQ